MKASLQPNFRLNQLPLPEAKNGDVSAEYLYETFTRNLANEIVRTQEYGQELDPVKVLDILKENLKALHVSVDFQAKGARAPEVNMSGELDKYAVNALFKEAENTEIGFIKTHFKSGVFGQLVGTAIIIVAEW